MRRRNNVIVSLVTQRDALSLLLPRTQRPMPFTASHPPSSSSIHVIPPHPSILCLQAFQSGFVESVRGAARALVMDVYGAREEGNPVSTSQASTACLRVLAWLSVIVCVSMALLPSA